jgi:hypothetical protein
MSHLNREEFNMRTYSSKSTSTLTLETRKLEGELTHSVQLTPSLEREIENTKAKFAGQKEELAWGSDHKWLDVEKDLLLRLRLKGMHSRQIRPPALSHRKILAVKGMAAQLTSIHFGRASRNNMPSPAPGQAWPDEEVMTLIPLWRSGKSVGKIRDEVLTRRTSDAIQLMLTRLRYIRPGVPSVVRRNSMPVGPQMKQDLKDLHAQGLSETAVASRVIEAQVQ